MRLSQQSFLDKYIEKIILGVAALIGLGIVYFFVLGTPYAIEPKPGERVAPDQIEKSYLDQANKLKMAIARTEPPQELVNLKIPDYVTRFDARYLQRLVNSDSFYGIVFGPPGVPGTSKPPEILRFVEVVKPPAPADLSASTSYHVLATDEDLLAYYSDLAHAQNPDAKPDVVKRLAAEMARDAIAKAGAKNPRDFHAASISGTINPQAWVDALAKVDPEKAMDPTWYQEVVQFIANIEVRRQTQNADGTWPDDKTFDVVPKMPGAVAAILNDYIKQVQDAKSGAKKVTEDEATELTQLLVENLRFYLEDLTKPQFLPVKAHRPWNQPDQVIPQLSPEDQAAIHKLNQQISRLEADLRALVGRQGSGETGVGGVPPRIVNPSDPYGLDRTDPRGTPKGTTKAPVPTKAPPQPPKGKQPIPGDPTAPKKSPNEERITLTQAKLDDLYKQKAEIINKLFKDEKDGKNPDGTPIDPSKPRVDPRIDPRNPNFRDPRFDPRALPGVRRPGQPFDPRNPSAIPDPDEADKLPPIKFWAHDVTVQPGKTYRYKVVYKVINPLFNKENSLLATQKAEAEKLELASDENGPWTTGVSIEPEVQYFVEDVNPQTSEVTWGIYRIHNGYRIHKPFKTRPGDAIGQRTEIDVKDDTGAKASAKELVDMRIPLIMVDLKKPAAQPGVINARGPTTVLLADITQGTMSTRDPNADKDNAERIRLSNEASGALAATGPTTTGPDGLPFVAPPGGRNTTPLLPPEIRPPPR